MRSEAFANDKSGGQDVTISLHFGSGLTRLK